MSNKKQAILLIDDSELLLRTTRRVVASDLKNLGRTDVVILIATTYDELSEELNRHEQKHSQTSYMLITDGQMPNMNGPDVIRALNKRLGDRLDLSVIFSANHDYAGEAQKLSAHFMIKTHVDHLIFSVKKFLDMS